MNDAFEKGVLSIEEQLDKDIALEAEGFDDEDGEKCVEVVFQIPIGLWQKIITHQPTQKAFVALLDDMVAQTRN